jgi:hypothetical protein
VECAIPYNLPPALCIKYEYMFLCLIIPGPDHPETNINVMLKPLIEELKHLWEGVEPYDYDQKQKINLRVAYLWSVHDFRAYNIFSGWSCNELLTCLICMKGISCFRLKFGGISITLIVIDVFCSWITHLGWTGTHLRRVILS